MRVFLAVFLIVSCSVNERSNKRDYKAQVETVDLGEDQKSKSLEIDSKEKRSAIGPSFSDEEVKKSAKVLIPGIYIGAGIYRSIQSLQLVKMLKKKGMSFQIFSGSGMGLVVASYLAAGKTIDQIEWFLFKLQRKLEGISPYTKDWGKLLISESEKFVGVKNIEHFKSILIVPLYDEKLKKMSYKKKGSYRSYLWSSLNMKTKDMYSTPLLKNYYSTAGLKKNSVDRVICINNLGERIKIERINHYVLGIFNRLKSFSSQEVNKWDFNLASRSELALDNLKNISDFRVEGSTGVEGQLEYLIENYEKKNL